MTIMMVFAVLFLFIGSGIAILGARGLLRSFKEDKLESIGEGVDDVVEEEPESTFVELEQPEAKLEDLNDVNIPEVDVVNLDKAKPEDLDDVNKP